MSGHAVNEQRTVLLFVCSANPAALGVLGENPLRALANRQYPAGSRGRGEYRERSGFAYVAVACSA